MKSVTLLFILAVASNEILAAPFLKPYTEAPIPHTHHHGDHYHGERGAYDGQKKVDLDGQHQQYGFDGIKKTDIGGHGFSHSGPNYGGPQKDIGGIFFPSFGPGPHKDIGEHGSPSFGQGPHKDIGNHGPHHSFGEGPHKDIGDHGPHHSFGHGPQKDIGIHDSPTFGHGPHKDIGNHGSPSYGQGPHKDIGGFGTGFSQGPIGFDGPHKDIGGFGSPSFDQTPHKGIGSHGSPSFSQSPHKDIGGGFGQSGSGSFSQSGSGSFSHSSAGSFSQSGAGSFGTQDAGHHTESGYPGGHQSGHTGSGYGGHQSGHTGSGHGKGYDYDHQTKVHFDDLKGHDQKGGHGGVTPGHRIDSVGDRYHARKDDEHVKTGSSSFSTAYSASQAAAGSYKETKNTHH